MSAASLSLYPSLDPAVPESVIRGAHLALRLLVLGGNGVLFAALMWLILAAPGFAG